MTFKDMKKHLAYLKTQGYVIRVFNVESGLMTYETESIREFCNDLDLVAIEPKEKAESAYVVLELITDYHSRFHVDNEYYEVFLMKRESSPSLISRIARLIAILAL